MLLTIDIGNTQALLGVYRGEEIVATWRVSSWHNRTADELGVFFSGFFDSSGIDRGELTGVAIASVVPALTNTFEDVCKRYLGLEPLVVGPGVRSGIPIRCDDPREVGADRIVNAVAAFGLYGGESIVVDFGTATTFDYVNAKGQYMGGVIAPGIGVSMEALFSRASKLPKVALERPPNVVGANTVHAMQSGIYYGYAALVDGLIERMINEVGGEPTVVATGGAAAQIAAESKLIEHMEEFLTLEGLRRIFIMNE